MGAATLLLVAVTRRTRVLERRRRMSRCGRATLAFGVMLGLGPVAHAAGPVPGANRAKPSTLECLVEPERRVMLSAPVEGVVAEVLVERGDVIQQGQLLAVLESSLEETNLAVAQAAANAGGELGRAKALQNLESTRWAQAEKLYEKRMISDLEHAESSSSRLVAESNVQQSEENRLQAQLELRRAEAALERRRIRSPIDGVVVRRLVSPGEYVDPPQILELAQIDPLRVEIFAPVSLLGAFSVGMPGWVTLEEPIAGEFEAKVVVVDSVVDAASGTFGVRLALPNPEHALPAGVKCQVRFR